MCIFTPDLDVIKFLRCAQFRINRGLHFAFYKKRQILQDFARINIGSKNVTTKKKILIYNLNQLPFFISIFRLAKKILAHILIGQLQNFEHCNSLQLFVMFMFLLQLLDFLSLTSLFLYQSQDPSLHLILNSVRISAKIAILIPNSIGLWFKSYMDVVSENENVFSKKFLKKNIYIKISKRTGSEYLFVHLLKTKNRKMRKDS